MKLKSVFFVLLLGSVSAMFYGINQNTSKVKTLKIGINTLPSSINPVYATNEAAAAVVNKIFDALYYFDAKGLIQRGLTENAHLYKKNNHREIQLQVKKGIFFSDGKELTAKDVVETVKLLKNKEFSYPYRDNIDFITEISQLDRYRLTFILEGKVGSWENYMTFKILNVRDIKKAKPETFRAEILTGTGPYRFKSIDFYSRIVLESNPFYPSANQGQMYDCLEFSLIAYTQLSPLKLLNREIDICELQPEHIDAYKKMASWQHSFSILKYKKIGYSFLVFNLHNTVLTKNIRNHFYNILIWQDFPTRFLNGKGERVVTPFLICHKQTIPERRHTTPLTQKVVINILINTESKLRKEFVLFLAQELKPFYIELNTVALEYQTFLEYLKKGRFDVALSGFVMDIEKDVGNIFKSDSVFNYASFKNPQMDSLLALGLSETSRKKSIEIYNQAYRIWLEELPLIPLFNLYYYMGVAKPVSIPSEIYTLVGANCDFLFNIQQWSAKKQ